MSTSAKKIFTKQGAQRKLITKAGNPEEYLFSRKYAKKYKPKSDMKVMKRASKLCMFCFVMPCLVWVLPLYLRIRVYKEESYPASVTDMRILDDRMSTVWCEGQAVTVNTTFKAFIVEGEPTLAPTVKNFTVRKSAVLKAGSQQYWGFYLLRGSSFEVSACARVEGSSLMVIEGHRKLRDCTHIQEREETKKKKVFAEEEQEAEELMEGVALFNYTNADVDLLKEKVKFYQRKVHQPKPKIHNSHLYYAEDLYLEELKASSAERRGLVRAVGTETPLPEPQSYPRVLNASFNKLDSFKDAGVLVLKQINEYLKSLRDRIEDETTDGSFLVKCPVRIKYELDKMVEKLEKEYGLSATFIAQNATEVSRDKERYENLKVEILNEVERSSLYAELSGKISEYPKQAGNSKETRSTLSCNSKSQICNDALATLFLVPNNSCEQDYTVHRNLDAICGMNSLSYKVTRDGYYFLVFKNENKMKENYLHIRFDFNKTLYDVSKAVASCENETEVCSLPIQFWSSQKMVVELPASKYDLHWNEEFIIQSACKPRMLLYLVCFFSIPFFVLLLLQQS